MQDILDNPQGLENRSSQNGRKNYFGLTLLLLLLAGAGGGGVYFGPKILRAVENYQCAKQGVEQKNPKAAFLCLERMSSSVSNLFVQLGFDVRDFYLRVITRWLDLKQYLKMLEVSRAGQTKFPWEPAFLGNQAIALFNLERHAEAVQALELFLSAENVKQTLAGNGVKIYLTAAQIYLGAQNIEKAEHYLRQVLEAEPQNTDAFLLYARLEAFRQNTDKMAEYYERALFSNSASIVWQDLFMLGLHYLNTNQIENFQKTFADSRRLFPNGSGFHLLLAVKFLKEGNYAAAYYEVLFEKEVGLTDAAFFEESIRQIEKQFNEAFQSKPAEPWFQTLYQFIHGKQAYEKKNYVQAFAWFEQSLQKEEHPLQSLYLGRALAGMGQTERAIGYYGKTLSQQETFALASAEMAGLYLRKGIIEAAQNLWSKALALDPQVATLSSVGAELAKLSIKSAEVKPSERYTVKLSDRMMCLQLNQMLLNAFSVTMQMGAHA
ncbi:MAG: hypothetical protein KBC91_01635 [Candidatus Omnitrophica bacterium]|nr:hypothetical protein [Candidatus Omnitrophota bacterium]